MSGTYAFLPWLRRGVATAIERKDGEAAPPATADDPTPGARAKIEVAVSLNTGDLMAKATLSLLGPGEVTGIDPRAVIRTWPRAGVYDAASNYFPLVEFDQPDLPWRYTPAAPDGQERLRPWLCLIALKNEEFTRSPPDAHHPLAVIYVPSLASLPKVGQSWAWAHVQVSGDRTIDGARAKQLLASTPERMLARLLCPRRLEPKTRYTAFLVPTFERGRLAGLGLPVPDGVDALQQAWPDTDLSSTAPVDLPVYFEWSFQSGEEQDFEFLMRQLKKGGTPSDAGKRDMDVSAPGAGRLPAASKPLGVECALKVPLATSTPWDAVERTDWVTSLKELVDAPTNLLANPGATRRVAPPLYGRWQAAQTILNPYATPWPWFDELNADPRLRVVAALGARVVESQQEQLMASAWRQVEGIRALNAELRMAQAAREVARRIHARHIAVANPEVVLQLTAPLHGRVRETASAGSTIRDRLSTSPIVPGALAPQWRRIARRFGPLGSRQGRAAAPALPTLLARLNSGELRLAQAPSAPTRMANLGILRIRPGITSAQLASAPGGGPNFGAAEYPPQQVGEPPTEPVNAGPDSSSGATFRNAVGAAWEPLTAGPYPSPLLDPVQENGKPSLGALQGRLIAELDPETTITDGYANRLHFPADWNPVDRLEPVMVAPQFPQPMVVPLRELSQDWLFSGLDKVPPNSMTLLEVNPRFINAYMVGLNYEMGRKLLWNGYPTDQRGTYFRQFWDPASYFAKPDQVLDPKSLEDIDPIDQWPPNPPNDTADVRIDAAGKQTPLATDPLVLLIRGDLLVWYPNMLLYAAPALRSTAGARVPDDDPAHHEHPTFGGTLKPDVSYFAFNLTRDKVRGTDTTSPEGWYFILQEQPSEARFGLNAAQGGSTPPVSWDDLTWDDLGGPVTDGAYIDLDANAPASAPTTNPEGAVWPRATGFDPPGRASDMAFITLQRQVRMAVHGSDMIPPS